jgi:hypothetical protein
MLQLQRLVVNIYRFFLLCTGQVEHDCDASLTQVGDSPLLLLFTINCCLLGDHKGNCWVAVEWARSHGKLTMTPGRPISGECLYCG